MKYLFLGGLYPKQLEQRLFAESRGKLSFAANLHQWNMIHGIESNIGEAVSIVNCYFFPVFPKSKRILIKSYGWSHREDASDYNVGYLNLKTIRNFSQAKRLEKYLRKVLDSEREDVTVFVYTARYSAMRAVYALKRKGYRIKVCLIVPDVPAILAQYEKRGLYDRLAGRYNLEKIKRFNSAVDCYVLLSEPMKELFEIGSRPYCIVDGIYSDEGIADERDEPIIRHSIVYTGSLHKEYGILDLLSEFEKTTDSSYKLIIAGSGNAAQNVADAALRDSRIVYLGPLPQREVFKLQRKADLLINPRPISGIDSRYSFPSKTIEYMLSGRSVLMNRLPGMAPEYEAFVYTPKNCQCNGFSQAIDFIFSLPEENRLEKAQNARNFVMRNKNAAVQAEKIIRMLND